MFLWLPLGYSVPVENENTASIEEFRYFPTQTTERGLEIHNQNHLELHSMNDSVNFDAFGDQGQGESQALQEESIVDHNSQDSLALQNNLIEQILPERKPLMFWIPTTSKVKTLFPKNYKVRSKVEVDSLLHQASNFSEETIHRLYSAHLKKYFSSLGILKGKVLDSINRKIKTSFIAMDRSIHGSEDFEYSCIEKIKEIVITF